MLAIKKQGASESKAPYECEKGSQALSQYLPFSQPFYVSILLLKNPP